MSIKDRTLDARRDTLDFRDRMYQPTLIEVPTRIALDDYKAWDVPVLDQSSEGACTGFGLATVAHFLLHRRRVIPDKTPVSPRMFYDMARRFDEWPGEEYSGSSARGAMKAWHKYGVCSESLWPYVPGDTDSRLTEERIIDALRRPLGSYFRVNHKDIVAMHSAIAEVGILYATANVHDGWDSVTEDGTIPLLETGEGGHAFAIVAFDEIGLWIQNSWGTDWGLEGFARITYDDWLANGNDIWVARLGAPIVLRTRDAVAVTRSMAGEAEAYTYGDLRPHIISVGNNGTLRPSGTYGTSGADVQAIFTEDFPRVTNGWPKKKLLLYAHGGLVPEGSAVQRVAEYRSALLENEVYPVAFSWKSDFWSTLKNILQDALSRRRVEGILDSAKDFMLDRLDDALEPLARNLIGKAQWDEMKENAILATKALEGGARAALPHIARLIQDDSSVEIHLLAHSAGAVFLAPLVQMLTTRGLISSGPMGGIEGLGIPIKTCTLWAPACTIELFAETYLPVIRNHSLEHFALFTLTDEAEKDDDCVDIYNKSLLYLVSNAFEEMPHIPGVRPGVPILGLEHFAERDRRLTEIFENGVAEWIHSPNTAPQGSRDHSTATTHGGYDDDSPTVRATIARILGTKEVGTRVALRRLEPEIRDRRHRLPV